MCGSIFVFFLFLLVHNGEKGFLCSWAGLVFFVFVFVGNVTTATDMSGGGRVQGWLVCTLASVAAIIVAATVGSIVMWDKNSATATTDAWETFEGEAGCGCDLRLPVFPQAR